ncbi:MAG: thiamine diphosphokinase [Oscillospiraceae bacterium]|jgi:thiamine pyrophosphokinase|nr:thiamine diphosphokinase [Oscillospiraceae bacterium]
MKAVLIGASPDAFWDRRWVPDLVLCADGGLLRTAELGLVPDLVIGDRDSGGEGGSAPAVILPAEKSMTDMDACLDRALTLGAEEIALLGATGGRLDHTLCNLGLLERAKGKAYILDSSHEVYLLAKPIKRRPPHPYRYFSVLPLDEEISGVTITGGKYPLVNALLRRDASVGVSNEPLPDTEFTVSVDFGNALLILSERS